MVEYKYDEESVKELVEWVRSTTFPQQIKKSESEEILDVKRFIEANLSDIKSHYPDSFYNPAIMRLYWLKENFTSTLS